MSSSGVSLRSWDQLYSTFNSILPMMHCHTDLCVLVPTTLSCWRVWSSNTHKKKAKKKTKAKAAKLGCACWQALSLAVAWESSGSTIAPTQHDGLVTLVKCCPFSAHTDFHNRAFTESLLSLSHFDRFIVAGSDCNVDDIYRSRSNTWWLSMCIRSLQTCQVTLISRVWPAFCPVNPHSR